MEMIKEIALEFRPERKLGRWDTKRRIELLNTAFFVFSS